VAALLALSIGRKPAAAMPVKAAAAA
jgi:hypothetical protein